MGIKGLTSFMNNRFTQWLPVSSQEWDHLIVDGNNVCYKLYNENYTWLLGGEYSKYGHLVRERFEELRAHFKNLIVIFDGAKPEEKMHTILQRREDAMKQMYETQKKATWDCSTANRSAHATPLLVMFVFTEVLRSLKIQFLFTEGEADNAIAGLANHHKCPVLASDSDYFMFQLDHGVIQLHDWLKNKARARLFNIHEFMKQFSLKEYEQCLLIPSIFGNDIIKKSDSNPYRNFDGLLREVSKFDTCQEFLRLCRDRKISANFKMAREFYCHLPLPTGFQARDTLPKWVFSGIETGHFLLYLFNAYFDKSYLLTRVVEVIGMESAWQISRHIREHLYGFMGLSADTQIEELTRIDGCPQLGNEKVVPKFLDPPVSVRDPAFESREGKKLQDIVLAVLKCYTTPESVALFDHLEEKWKLPIAATSYWYRHLSDSLPNRKNLLKSLLLSFLACSEVIPDDVPPLPPVNRDTRSVHLTALHAFAQWQCVYYDARALNYLAREPFPTTSPAFLYSGQVAMHYATIVSHEGNWLTPIIVKDSTEWKLINQLLDLVA